MPTISRYAATLLFLATTLSLQAEDKKPDAMSAQEKMAEFVRLSARLQPLIQQKNYAEMAAVCRRQSELMPRVAEPQYNLACALALLKQKDEALAALAKAAELGFDDAAHMDGDDDLASLRGEARYKEILAKTKANDAARVEKGAEIPGVKTLEGAPDGGLRYRLRLAPAASKEKPARLIVWMHPSGGSMNAAVEALAPRFNKAGFALLVFTKKNFAGWSGAELPMLSKTLDEVAKIAGVSDDRPVLMGFSAGGQMALELWSASGAGLGGLVLDAAYPVRMGAGGKYVDMPPPKNEAALKTPMFVLVGSADGGSQVWKKAEESYRKNGTPLTITYLEGRKHEWLFGAKELDALDKWLDELARQPADKTPAKSWRPAIQGN